MKIYIAYKYRYTKDKEELKNTLEGLSQLFEKMGNKAFILGRDVQKWNKHGSRISTLRDIVTNIWKHDTLFAYINSDVSSHGIPVEFALAKLFGLKTYIARQSDLKPYFLEKLADKVILFSSIQDLHEKIQKVL